MQEETLVEPQITEPSNMTLSDRTTSSASRPMPSAHCSNGDTSFALSASKVGTFKYVSSNKLPPILLLPVELTLHILSHLKATSRIDLLILRQTHPSFRRVIPDFDLPRQLSRLALSFDTKSLRAKFNIGQRLNYYLENAESYAVQGKVDFFPPNHYPCYMCHRVLPSDQFTDKRTQGCRILGGTNARMRFCVLCGIKLCECFDPSGEFDAIISRRGKRGGLEDRMFVSMHQGYLEGQLVKTNGVEYTQFQCWRPIDYTGNTTKSDLNNLVCMGCGRDFKNTTPLIRGATIMAPPTRFYQSKMQLLPKHGVNWPLWVHTERYMYFVLLNQYPNEP